jgi:hypothetical protein
VRGEGDGWERRKRERNLGEGDRENE